MGETKAHGILPMNEIHDTVQKTDPSDEYESELNHLHIQDGASKGNVYGTYIHGIFDREEIVTEVIRSLADKKGISIQEEDGMDLNKFKETQYNLLADTLREHLDMEQIYKILAEEED